MRRKRRMKTMVMMMKRVRRTGKRVRDLGCVKEVGERLMGVLAE